MPIRHSAVVRITHWINTIVFLALLVSGAAILIAHPRLYWGETGGFGSPAFIELPLPLNLDQSGWGRSLHFLAAWVCVINGTVYILTSLASSHFTMHMQSTYNALQRTTYLAVVLVLFPLMIATGLAMSPAVSAAVPVIIRFFGGYQSSRTIHFFVTNVLTLFLIVHIAMVIREGFIDKVGGMIVSRSQSNEHV